MVLWLYVDPDMAMLFQQKLIWVCKYSDTSLAFLSHSPKLDGRRQDCHISFCLECQSLERVVSS